MASWDPVARRFRCHYTGVPLDEKDLHSPWYLTFDHVIPGKKGTLVVCAAWVNVMKNALSEEEFRAIIIELARCKETGEPFNLAVAEFKYWKGPAANTPAGRRAAPNMRFPKEGRCVICFDPTRPYSPYCRVCGKIVDMRHDKPGIVAAMQAARDPQTGAFHCYLTKLKVELQDRKSPCYITLDHQIPKKKGTLRVAVAFANLMKSDLSEDQFWLVVKELARHFLTGGPYNRNVIKFTYWRRGGRARRN